MIDFHNHTIPNLDDGPKSIEDALKMFKEAEKQGISDVVNTVHFQHPKMQGKDTSYEYIISKINEMNQILSSNKIDVKPMITDTVAFDDSIKAFERAAKNLPEDVKIQIQL